MANSLYAQHVTRQQGLVTRRAWVRLSTTCLLCAVVPLVGSATDAAEPSTQPAAPANADDEHPPEDGVARPDAPDLLGGHFIITVDGGVWAPSSGLFPDIPELGEIDVGGTVHGHIGVGLNRYLVLDIVDGGFARAPSSRTTCESCGAWSIDIGASLVLRPTQGFALDPWVSYGVGYRHTILTLDTGDEKVLAMDVAKLALGADWYPDPVFGLGPYLETDIGIVTSGEVKAFAVFHSGLRITFDPLRAGATAAPGTARRY